jgi:hypothetical protein
VVTNETCGSVPGFSGSRAQPTRATAAVRLTTPPRSQAAICSWYTDVERLLIECIYFVSPELERFSALLF